MGLILKKYNCNCEDESLYEIINELNNMEEEQIQEYFSKSKVRYNYCKECGENNNLLAVQFSKLRDLKPRQGTELNEIEDDVFEPCLLVLDSNNPNKCILEYNHSGAKVTDIKRLLNYLTKGTIDFIPVSNDESHKVFETGTTIKKVSVKIKKVEDFFKRSKDKHKRFLNNAKGEHEEFDRGFENTQELLQNMELHCIDIDFSKRKTSNATQEYYMNIINSYIKMNDEFNAIEKLEVLCNVTVDGEIEKNRKIKIIDETISDIRYDDLNINTHSSDMILSYIIQEFGEKI